MYAYHSADQKHLCCSIWKDSHKVILRQYAILTWQNQKKCPNIFYFNQLEKRGQELLEK